MELIFRLMDRLGWERVILALLHSLWQGALVGVVVWFVLRQVPASRARLRYGIAVAGLFMVLVGALVTFEILGDSVTPKVANQPIASAIGPAILETHVYAAPRQTNSESPTISKPALMIPQKWTWLGVIWLAGSCIMLARAVASVVGAGRLLNRCEFVTDPTMLATLLRVKQSMRIARPVRMATGASIHIPAVLGTLVPVILLPLSALGQMPVAHLEMILAHELAHIRRHDYLINLLQLLIEALLFFNPAIWWLSRQVRIEREACCDAMAVTVTGKGSDYARSLAEIVAGLVGSQAGLGVTPAMAGEGSIVDRVRRVLAPMSRPIVRLPWYRFIGTSVVAIVLLAGMWGGTHVAVAAAEKILSPAEQVDQITALQNQLQPAAQSDQSRQRELHGTIRTEDSKPLPKGVTIIVESHVANASTTGAIPCDAKGNFSWNAPGGSVRIWVAAPGYAPIMSVSILTRPDGTFPQVELSLKVGFEQAMQVTDEAGKPIADAPVSVNYGSQIDDFDPLPEMRFTTDGDGRFVISHAAERTALVTTEIHGYQFDISAVKLAPGTEPSIKLMAAAPTQGVVTDEATGQPLAGAAIHLVQRDGFVNRVFPPNGAGVEMPVLAITDAQGGFTLDTLRQGCDYILYVTAKDHASSLIRPVHAGQTGLEWKLGRTRPVTVTIHAPAGRMPRSVNVSNPLVIGNTSYDYGSELPVKVKDGVGTAVLKDPLPGTVRFYVGKNQVEVDPAKQNGPVELSLDTPAGKKQKTRKVVVQLDVPKDGLTPKGRVHIEAMTAGPNAYYPLTDAEIKNGQVEFSAPVPTKLDISQGSVVGYLVSTQSNIEVADDSEPLVLKVQLSLAGAIGGVVSDENGKPFSHYCSVSLITVQSASGSSNQPTNLQPFNCNDGSGRFLLMPVPLGGTYRIVACAGPRLVLSDEINIDQEHMLQKVDLKFAAGVAVTGTVVDVDGKPMVGRSVQLDCYPVESNCFGASAVTGRTGTFVFEHVDSKSADYDLSVAPLDDLQGFEAKHLAVSDQPLRIESKRGVSARGKLIDATTNQPIANQKVLLTAKSDSNAAYQKGIEVLTDQDGVFEARGLEEVEYVVSAPGTLPPGTVALRDPAGKVTGFQVGQEPEPVMKGGQEGVAEIRRFKMP